MKLQILVAFFFFFTFQIFGQKLSKEQKALQRVCSEYTETVEDPFSEKMVKKIIPIRCGKEIYMSAYTKDDSVIMVLKLMLRDIRSGDVNSSSTHEFSLQDSEEKKVIKFKSLGNVTPTTGSHTTRSNNGAPAYTIYYTVYEISYYLEPEILKDFTTKSLNAVRITLGNEVYTSEVNNEKRAKAFKDALKCLTGEAAAIKTKPRTNYVKIGLGIDFVLASNPLTLGSLGLSYQKVFGKKNAITIGAEFIPGINGSTKSYGSAASGQMEHIDLSKILGGGLNVGYRRYLSKAKDAPIGFYLEPNVGISYLTTNTKYTITTIINGGPNSGSYESSSSVSGSYLNASPCLSLGYQFLINDKFNLVKYKYSLDVQLLMGYSRLLYSNSNKTTTGRTPISVSSGLLLGVNFMFALPF